MIKEYGKKGVTTKSEKITECLHTFKKEICLTLE